MFDVGSIFANLDVGWDGDLTAHDYDGNEVLDAKDCPFPGGSTEAKLWWRNVMEPYAYSRSEAGWTEQYGDAVVGGYKGKPLVPGQAGSGQGDFEFLVDKLRVTQGLSYQSAVKVAGKVKAVKFG